MTGADMIVTRTFICEACDGGGRCYRGYDVYEHGCGFSHRDVEDAGPCPECQGDGFRIVEVDPASMVRDDTLPADDGLRCSGLLAGKRCAHGFRVSVACWPTSLEQAARVTPMCCDEERCADLFVGGKPSSAIEAEGPTP